MPSRGSRSAQMKAYGGWTVRWDCEHGTESKIQKKTWGRKAGAAQSRSPAKTSTWSCTRCGNGPKPMPGRWEKMQELQWKTWHGKSSRARLSVRGVDKESANSAASADQWSVSAVGSVAAPGDGTVGLQANGTVIDFRWHTVHQPTWCQNPCYPHERRSHKYWVVNG